MQEQVKEATKFHGQSEIRLAEEKPSQIFHIQDKDYKRKMLAINFRG